MLNLNKKTHYLFFVFILPFLIAIVLTTITYFGSKFYLETTRPNEKVVFKNYEIYSEADIEKLREIGTEIDKNETIVIDHDDPNYHQMSYRLAFYLFPLFYALMLAIFIYKAKEKLHS